MSDAWAERIRAISKIPLSAWAWIVVTGLLGWYVYREHLEYKQQREYWQKDIESRLEENKSIKLLIEEIRDQSQMIRDATEC